MPRENPSPAIIKSCIVVGAAYMLIVAPFRPAAAAPPSPQLEADRAALVQGNTRFALDLHPFVFLIYDRANGSILFMGRVANPK